MLSLDRILHADLARIAVPRILLKGLLGYALAGLLLAVFVPPLHRRGFPLQRWMVWSTIVLMIAICVAPDAYRTYRRRRIQS